MATKSYVIMRISEDGMMKYATNRWGDSLCPYGVTKKEALDIIDKFGSEYEEYILMPVYRAEKAQ